jgi:DNA sulfur modification protein DndD
MEGYKKEEISRWYSELKKFEEIYDYNQQNLGAFKEVQKECEKNVEFMQKDYDQELKNKSEFGKLRKHINFTQKALRVLKQSKKYVMDEIKQEIEAETRSLFLDLIWKKGTFESVNIDQDFNLHLIHSIGYDCLGTVGAGERELLALSFTIALHKISGFDFSILIDTPVARLSPEHREKFAEIFSKLSKEKQIILLVLPSPSEYSDEMGAILNGKVSNKYELKLSPDEREVRI